jgi:superfamily II DNA/RNA helicase
MRLLQVYSSKMKMYKGDILGASKTGSGKTLAYLIPLIE